jgi:hypothetical protein
MKDRCEAEIVELHQFFEDWFMGRLDNSDEAFHRFEGVMAEGFTMIPPGGSITERAELLHSLRRAHGVFSEGRAISIRVANIQPRHTQNGHLLLTYEEWQDEGQGERGRLSSVLFRRHDAAPNGVEWLHVHETWMS